MSEYLSLVDLYNGYCQTHYGPKTTRDMVKHLSECWAELLATYGTNNPLQGATRLIDRAALLLDSMREHGAGPGGEEGLPIRLYEAAALTRWARIASGTSGWYIVPDDLGAWSVHLNTGGARWECIRSGLRTLRAIQRVVLGRVVADLGNAERD